MKINIILNSDIRNSSEEEKLAAKLSHVPFYKLFSFSSSKVSDLINEEDCDYFVFIEDNNFYWSESIWGKFLHFLQNSTEEIIVPVGNHNGNVANITQPFYLTLNDLEKINLYRNDNNKFESSDKVSLEPIFAISLRKLKSIGCNIFLNGIKKIIKNEEVLLFNQGWLHYFNFDAGFDNRTDLFQISNIYGDVLEIGCFKGNMAKTGKLLNDCKWTGIDIHLQNLNYAKKFIDFPINAEVTNILPIKKTKRFDFIICADFIEHIPYPWILLKDFKNHIKKEGRLILSVPNIGHWSVIKDLFEGRFDETPSGILCVTHLRHGTLKNWLNWLEEAGWEVIKIVKEKIPLNDSFEEILKLKNVQIDMESLETYRFKFIARNNVL
jgi:2-polyprenyl-3-methyl-5-hydroxy-6-metoxy-1,4-benzoquinol methylase